MIEIVLGVLGIDVGYCYFFEARGTSTSYETSLTFENEAWYRLLVVFVLDLWVIVWNLYRWFVSDFLWVKYLGLEFG